jgi:hypothetical protein
MECRLVYRRLPVKQYKYFLDSISIAVFSMAFKLRSAMISEDLGEFR